MFEFEEIDDEDIDITGDIDAEKINLSTKNLSNIVFAQYVVLYPKRMTVNRVADIMT